MGNNRSKVPDLEKLVKGGRKKFVRYEEGAMLYSMGIHTFQQLAKDARAVYHQDKSHRRTGCQTAILLNLGGSCSNLQTLLHIQKMEG